MRLSRCAALAASAIHRSVKCYFSGSAGVLHFVSELRRIRRARRTAKDIVPCGGNKITLLEIDDLLGEHPDVAAALCASVFSK
jgi:hypothetical protein